MKQLELFLLETAQKQRIPPYVWRLTNMDSEWYKGRSFWDLELVRYRLGNDGILRMAGYVYPELANWEIKERKIKRAQSMEYKA